MTFMHFVWRFRNPWTLMWLHLRFIMEDLSASLTGTASNSGTRIKWYRFVTKQYFQMYFNDDKQFNIHMYSLFLALLGCRSVTSDALCGHLWIRRALLAERPHRGLCGETAHGFGTWSLWSCGESGLCCDAPQSRLALTVFGLVIIL